MIEEGEAKHTIDQHAVHTNEVVCASLTTLATID
jgi:hypothetical protein